ncbi:hypothetical protein LTR56_020316 [Elasticomyces elasticus]|nr:hypothetical protein LTR56_020316 [Elasticomyces elasticus]KAK3655628.1 hypothetical protein LTR22_010218 [Elasticomyces elasticus]KAK4910286.1 hypothetical protein LTR49_021032 [Elasticomyces elasticus]KAK5748524.1 hypothetical protein LTS12_021426 [Elasticomyces elasticus]
MASPTVPPGSCPITPKRKRSYERFDEVDLTFGLDASCSVGADMENNQQPRKYSLTVTWPNTTTPKDCGADGPAYSSEFDDMSSCLRDLLAQVAALTREHEDTNNRFQGLSSQADTLSRPLSLPILEIMLVGPSGSGKSALIMSILDQLGLTRSIAVGRRGTDVATTYQRPLPGQSKEYAATVVVMPPEHRLALITLLLDWHLAWHCQSHSDSEASELTEQRATTSSEAFSAMFGTKPQSQTEETALGFLQGDRAEILAIMCAWCDELILEAAPQTLLEADTAEELQHLLKRLDSSGSSALWPLVDRIRVGIKSCYILRFISITDSPGSTDGDELRAGIFRRLLPDHDELWIVVDVKRITTEPTTKNFVREHSSTGLKTVIIPTRSDDNMENPRGMYDEFHDQAVKDNDAVQLANVVRLKADIESRERLIYQKLHLVRDLKALKSGSDVHQMKRPRTESPPHTSTATLPARIASCEHELSLLDTQLHEAGRRTRSSQVVARNHDVERELAKVCSKWVANGRTLDVHNVSNTHYAAHKDDLGEQAACMSLEETGIIGLRRYVYVTLAMKRLQALRDYLETDIAPFANSLAMRLDPSKLRGHDEVVKLLEAAVADIDGLVNQTLARVPQLVDEALTQPLCEKREAFAQIAVDIFNGKYKEWLKRSSLAFMRNNGRHKTTCRPQESWNQQFAQPAVSAVDRQLETLESNLAASMDALGDGVIQMSNGILNRATDMAGDVLGLIWSGKHIVDLKRFQNFTKGHVQGVDKITRDMKVSVIRKIWTEKTLALLDGPDSCFWKGMQSAYDSCKLDLGNGVTDRCAGTIRSLLTCQDDASPFIVMFRLLSTVIITTITNEIECFRASVKQKLQLLRNELDAEIRKANSTQPQVGVPPGLDKLLKAIEKSLEDSRAGLKRLVGGS